MNLLLRITDAIQRQHESISELKSLVQEFDDTTERLREMTDLLQSRFDGRPFEENVIQMPQPDDDFQIPRALQSGPRRGD